MGLKSYDKSRMIIKEHLFRVTSLDKLQYG